jgi:hypothetical protein
VLLVATRFCFFRENGRGEKGFVTSETEQNVYFSGKDVLIFPS